MTCPHGYRTASSCLDCMMEGPLPPAPKEELRIAFVFDAKYDSTCPVCNGEINVGDRIARLTDDSYVCAMGCAIEACR